MWLIEPQYTLMTYMSLIKSIDFLSFPEWADTGILNYSKRLRQG